MNKAELIEAVATETGISKAQAGKAIDAFIDAVTESLKKGDDVALIGFGTFSVTDRPERDGRNPATGAAIKIPASKQPKFSAGKKLKEAVN